MSCQRAGWPLFLMGLIASCLVAQTPKDNAKKSDPKKDDKQVVDSKPDKYAPAAAINFKKDLGIPYPTLGTLGTRIDSARRTPDPMALAHAASELAVAEKVSGKKTSLPSKELLKE